MPWLYAAPPDFVKMDTEGSEFLLVPVMADWLKQKRPKLLLSLHGALLHHYGLMSRADVNEAQQKIGAALSFYCHFEELASGKTFPIAELAPRLSALAERTLKAVDIFLQ